MDNVVRINEEKKIEKLSVKDVDCLGILSTWHFRSIKRLHLRNIYNLDMEMYSKYFKRLIELKFFRCSFDER